MGNVAVGSSSEGGHYDVDVCGGNGKEEREERGRRRKRRRGNGRRGKVRRREVGR